jgi:dienelactone hydrolase
MVASGVVDPARIYVTGWSNGAFFSALYAIARQATPTPGGHRVAAAALYAGANPFATTTVTQTPTCATAPPATSAPMYMIHRACDALVPCNGATTLPATPPGYDVEGWLMTLGSTEHDTAVTDVIIDDNGTAATACATSCPLVTGTENHLRWPDGVADRGGMDWEPAMLGFLRDHPLR